MSAEPKKVIVICGPTACGKSSLGLFVARRDDGEIIGADSMQIYKHLDIGTAKPTAREMREISHHLIDICEPSETFSVTDYIARAEAAIADVLLRGKQPIVVGGTGQYISALLDGLEFTGLAPDEALRARICAQYDQDRIRTFERLEKVDPASAKKVHLNNKKRVVRALEYYELTGEPISLQTERSVLRGPRFDFSVYYLNYSSRAVLYEAIERRVDAMLDAGLLDEAKYVYDNRAEFKTAAQAIGYKELFAYFDGTSTLDECTELLKQKTRNYAKRQISWFNGIQAATRLESGAQVQKTAEKI